MVLAFKARMKEQVIFFPIFNLSISHVQNQDYTICWQLLKMQKSKFILSFC